MKCEIVKLKDLCHQGKGTYGIPASAVPFNSNLYTYLRITDISDDGRLLKENLVSVDDVKAPKYLLHPGDIVFARTGNSTGRNYFYDGHDGKLVYAGFLIKFSIDPQKVNPFYIKYYCQSKRYLDWIQSFNTGSTRGNINAQTYAEMEVLLPSRTQQDLLVDVLSALDDKIELNNRINKNLEAQAQAIFKSWFVDFEPFQDGEFVESEMGLIPKGWSVQPLTSIAEYLNGLAMQKYRPMEYERGIPVLKIKELRQGQCDNSSELCSQSIKPDYVIHDGDVVFSWSGTLFLDIWCGGVCGLNQHLFKITSKVYDKWLYYFWTKHYLDEFISIAAGKATTMGHIKRGDLEKSLVIIPEETVYKKASKLLTPILDQIILTRKQSRTLAAIRDTLLPKLMSGEIRVPLEV